MKKVKITLLLVCALSISFAQTPAIKYQVVGKGTPILFLPGFASPGSIWDETIANLDGNYESHKISYAGFNGIKPIDTPWYSKIKEALILYVKSNNLENVQIIGHSMGGNLAIELAAALPSKVKSLLLVESIPCMREVMMPGVSSENIQYDSPYNNQLLIMDSSQFKNMASGMASYMTTKKDKIEKVSQWLIETDRKTYVYGYTDLLKLDLRETLKTVKANTLILGATFPDAAVAKTNYQNQYSNLADKQIEMVVDSKHFIMFDQPEWFYEKTNSFLTDAN